MAELREIDPQELDENVFRLIGSDWMLITAGDKAKFNTMTASWGALGVLWNKKIAICFVRPIRFTFEFLEKSDVFTLSFFDEKHRSALNYLGSHSGRDEDKVAKSGLKPCFRKEFVSFEESKLVLGCRKIYFDDLKPSNFLDSSIAKNYPKKDYHRIYVGEIVTCFKRQI